MRDPLLTADHFSVYRVSDGERLPLLENLSVTISHGETFTLVGESGSGKTTFAHAVTGLLPRGTHMIIEGHVVIDGEELVFKDPEAMRRWRRTIRYVFQEPWLALNPLARIRSQFAVAARTAGLTGNSENVAGRFLDEVGIENSRDLLDAYPHQLSGGQAQRVMIALALLSSPKLLIADEPTSSLDAMHRLHILELLRSLKERHGLSILLVTHDLEIARRFGDRVAVLYAGRIVEESPAEDLFRMPLHPYSQALVQCSAAAMPFVERSPENATAAEPRVSLSGCRFYPRCRKVQSDCRDREPALQTIDSRRLVRCPYWKS